MDLKIYIGKKIQKLRKQREISQAGLGKVIGYASATVCQLENGQFRVPLDVLAKIADFFGVPLEYFLPESKIEKYFPAKMGVIEHRLESALSLLEKEVKKIKKGFFYVSVTGNIGVGKSKIIESLAEKFGGEGFSENAKQNPFLEKFYLDAQKWAFKNELWFLAENFYQQTRILKTAGPTFQGRTIFENYHIFAKLFKELGYISSDEFEILKRFYLLSKDLVKIPDLAILIEKPVNTILKGLKKKKEFNEEKITRQYLEKIQEKYYLWAKTFTVYPVLVVKHNGVNKVTQRVTSLIRQHLTGK